MRPSRLGLIYQNISPITRLCVNGAEVQVTLRDALALELEGMVLAHLAMPRKGFAGLFVEREGENTLCRRGQVVFREMEGQAAHRLPHVDFHAGMDAERSRCRRAIEEHIHAKRTLIGGAIEGGKHLAYRLFRPFESREADICLQLLEAIGLRPQEIT